MNTTEQGNKAIAEFDGWYQVPEINSGSDINWFHDEYSTKITNNLSLPSSPSNFKYHTSWDWLMSVVKKIKEDAMQNPYPAKGAILHGNLNQALMVADISKVWQAVVEFINWYNKNKK